MTVTSGLRGLSTLRIFLFLPVITPTIVGSIAWRILFREDGGLFNSALSHLGISPIPWLTGYPWVLVTAMIVTLWKGFGYFMMIFVAALMAVSPELEEACMIDGAGRASVFWNVTFPSIRPGPGAGRAAVVNQRPQSVRRNLCDRPQCPHHSTKPSFL